MVGITRSKVITFLTWKFASRHNGVHFFRHLNVKKWSENGVLCTFWLGNMLPATTACTLSTSELPKVVQMWGAFSFFNFQMCFAPQRRAIFLISHLASWLRTCRFSEPTFRPSRVTNHWKNTESHVSYLFVHLHLLSSHSFSSLIFSLLGFSSLTLPTSAFPSVHIVGSLTSKLPSINFVLA